jgi:ribosomal protein L29
VKGEVKVSELRNKKEDELQARIVDLKRDMFVNLSAGVGNENKGMSRKKAICRKEIARIMTILRERELDQIFEEILL